MTFRVGDTVRINAGQMYGQVGTIVAQMRPSGHYVVKVNGEERGYPATELLDSHQNNGD